MKRVATALVIGLLSFPGFEVRCDAEGEDELRTRVEELERQLAILKGQLAQRQKESAVPPEKSTPVITAGSEGFSFQSADTNFVLRLRGTIQGDARFYPESGAGSAKDTFLLRRVRPALEGTVYDKFDYRLMFDFGSGLASTPANMDFVQEAYINARLWPEFQIQAGKFKEPVGLERLKADTDMVFIERNYPTLLVPNRDVGVQLQGELARGAVSYQAGIFNGVADSGSGDAETADGDKDFAGRVFVQPFKRAEWNPARELGIGLAGTIGRQKGTLRSFVSPGQQRIFGYRTGAGSDAASANVTAEGEHWRLVPQAAYYWGRLGVLAEYAISDQRIRRTDGGPATFGEVQNRAWQVTASYFLTGDRNSFGRISPSHPVSFRGDGGWGAWELAGQVGQLRIGENAFPLFASPSASVRQATSWGAGLNWYPNRMVKLMLDFERTDFKGGSGSAAAAPSENVILTRMQMAF